VSGEWAARAACAGKDADLFAPLEDSDRRGDGGASRVCAAVAICGTCPVRNECLENALQIRGSGIWGGVYVENGVIRHDITDRAARRAGRRAVAR
jgi:hypothetical protein